MIKQDFLLYHSTYFGQSSGTSSPKYVKGSGIIQRDALPYTVILQGKSV